MKKIVFSLMSLVLLSISVFAQSDLQPLAVIKLNKNESITVKHLKSRCEIINFALPNQQNTLSWLKLLPNIANKNNAEINSALAYCNQSPLLAEQILNTNFLNNTTWLKQFLQALEKPKQIDFIALSAIIEKESKNSDSNAINSAMNFSLILLCDVLQKWLVDLILLYFHQ